MITMGGDFQYMNADKNFKNLDKLIKHVNARVSNAIVNFLKAPYSWIKMKTSDAERNHIS